ncbi:MAG: right-handed parallel beta-helix repeat-containing protein [Myxococcales bacterium]|nr:right-handed parallel beta-helix repeat-containing protein [Myxococcales bacterium]
MRPRLLVLAVLASLSVVLPAACSSGDDEVAAQTPPPPPPPPPDGPAAADAGMMSVRVLAVSTTSGILSWYSFAPASTQADWGLDGSYGTTTTLVPGLVTQHFVPLTGLAPDTTYHFRVRSVDGAGIERVSVDHAFTTLPDTCATGTDHYVDAAVATSGDGSSWATAWQGPAEVAWGALAPGDCVNFRAGTYTDAVVVQASGAAGSPLVLKPHGPVFLSAGVQVPAGSSHVRLQGFEVSTTALGSPDGLGVWVEGDHVEVLDNYVHHTAYLAGISVGGSFATVRNNLVYFAEGIAFVVAGSDNLVDDNDASHSVCFEVGDADASRFFGTRNVLSHNFFHDVVPEDTPGASPHCDCFQTYAVNPGEVAQDITIENNYCFNIGGQMFMGEGLLAEDSHHDITFRGNVFDTVGAIAFNGGGIRNLVVHHNTFVHTGLGAVNVQVDGGSLTSNLFYENPYAYACDGCTMVDYNLVWPFDCHMDFAETNGTYGVDPVVLDPAGHDFRPAPGSRACSAGPEGGHVGAYPCSEPTGCWDPDADGYGRPASGACPHPEEDCDNGNAAVHPGAAEACNARDDDCNGLRDEDCPSPEPVLSLAFEGDLVDASPNQMPAAWTAGAGSYAAGHTGQAISIAGGSSPWVVVPEDPKLGGMSLLTVSVWAKKNGATGGQLFLKHVTYALGIGADSVRAYVNAEGGQADLAVYGGVPIDDTAWHHYALTYDARTGRARLLVDGAEVSSATTAGRVRFDPCDPREVNIGGDPWGDAFDGLIDDFVVYDALVTN